MNNEKIINKCDKLLKKIFGNIFYFVHYTRYDRIKPILENGKIKISTIVRSENPEFIVGGLEYVYCWIKYDCIPLSLNDSYLKYGHFFINPKILLYENVIFNSIWHMGPIEEEKLTNTTYKNIISEPFDPENQYDNMFSVYLNKNDTKEEKLKKLKKIKKYISYIAPYNIETNNYKHSHEFLFSNGIDLKKYLIGIYLIDDKSQNYKQIKKIIEKKFKHVKIFNGRKLPKLFDILC